MCPAWRAISQSSPEGENKQAWFSVEGEQPQMFLFQAKPKTIKKNKANKQKANTQNTTHTSHTQSPPSHGKRDSNSERQHIQVDKSCRQTESVSPEHSLPAAVGGQIGCQESPKCAETQLLQMLFHPVLGIWFCSKIQACAAAVASGAVKPSAEPCTGSGEQSTSYPVHPSREVCFKRKGLASLWWAVLCSFRRLYILTTRHQRAACSC